MRSTITLDTLRAFNLQTSQLPKTAICHVKKDLYISLNCTCTCAYKKRPVKKLCTKNLLCEWHLGNYHNMSKKAHTHIHRPVQGGEDPSDTLSCRSFFAKEPLILGIFCGKWHTKTRYPTGLRHPVKESCNRDLFSEGHLRNITTQCHKRPIYVYTKTCERIRVPLLKAPCKREYLVYCMRDCAFLLLHVNWNSSRQTYTYEKRPVKET